MHTPNWVWTLACIKYKSTSKRRGGRGNTDLPLFSYRPLPQFRQWPSQKPWPVLGSCSISLHRELSWSPKFQLKHKKGCLRMRENKIQNRGNSEAGFGAFSTCYVPRFWRQGVQSFICRALHWHAKSFIKQPLSRKLAVLWGQIQVKSLIFKDKRCLEWIY